MAFGAVLAAALLWAAAPAVARYREYSANLTLTGSVTASWHGDRARGCAEAGLCDYHGSSTVQPGSYGDLELVTRGSRVVGGFGFASLDEEPVVRVARGEEAACLDSRGGGELRVSFVRRGSGRARVAVDFAGTLGRGVCAGPDLSPLLRKAFGRTVSLARLRRSGVALSLRSRRPYVSGRFAGVLRSSLELRVGRPSPARQNGGGGSSAPAPPRAAARLERFVRLNGTYRVSGLSGKLTTTFGALAAPPCAGFDLCGAAGSSNWALLSAGGRLHVEAYVRARPGEHGLRGALAAIRRSRSGVTSYGTVTHGLGTTSALVSWPGGRTCRDSEPVVAPGFSFTGARREIPISLGDEETYIPVGDFVRTGCPGPPATDVLGGASIADGTLPLGALRARRLTVPLRAAGSFHDRAYAGSRRAHFTLRLKRESLRVAYREVRR